MSAVLGVATVVYHSIFEEYPGIDKTETFARLRRSMEERIPQVFENEFMFPDGSTRWFELRVRPVPEGICVYSSDIHHRKAVSSLLRSVWHSMLGRTQTPR